MATAFPVTDKKLVSVETFNNREFRYHSITVVSPGTPWEFDLVEQLGQNGANVYDLNHLVVDVFTLDTAPQSGTYGLYVPGAANVGFTTEGRVRVLTQYADDRNFLIRIRVPHKIISVPA